MSRKPFVGGNWKMNTDQSSASNLARRMIEGLSGEQGVEVAVFPPFPYLLTVGAILRERVSAIRLGAQDLHHEFDGAFTGEVSASMLIDCGVQVVLTGHSERRHVLGETDDVVNQKTLAALNSGLDCILCVGELLEEREAGTTDQVNERQVRAGLAGVPVDHMPKLTIAYEPVWAIGTGRTASPDDAQSAQAKIRSVLADMHGDHVADSVRIQYGGSVNAGNASTLFAEPDVDGGLIGGASLKAKDFCAIVHAASETATPA